MNTSLNSSLGDLISKEPRWTPFHERISAWTAEKTMNSPISKKKLGFKGLSDQAGSKSEIDDVIGLCSGTFETQIATKVADVASGVLLPLQQKLSLNASDIWPIKNTRDDFCESQIIEDYEDDLIYGPPIKSNDNNDCADEEIVEDEEENEFMAEKSKNSLKDVDSPPIICGPARSTSKTMIKPCFRVSSNAKERNEMKQQWQYHKGCMECRVGRVNCSGHRVPVENKSHKRVWGRNTRTGLYEWKRRYGTVVEIVKSKDLDSSGPNRSIEITNLGKGKY